MFTVRSQFCCQRPPAPNRVGHRLPHGLSLIELIVVIAIIAVVVSLVGSASFRMLENSRQAKCLSNLRQLGVATRAYVNDHDGRLPIALVTPTGGSGGNYWHGSFGAWFWNLAPYADELAHPGSITWLGADGEPIRRANIFTCPAHGRQEPNYFRFPTYRPVSYAPTNRLFGTAASDFVEVGDVTQEIPNLRRIINPSKTVWLSDSTHPNILNVALSRWDPNAPLSQAWARQSFTRHGGASGNALFLDGHAGAITYESMLEGSLLQNVRRHFVPETH